MSDSAVIVPTLHDLLHASVTSIRWSHNGSTATATVVVEVWDGRIGDGVPVEMNFAEFKALLAGRAMWA